MSNLQLSRDLCGLQLFQRTQDEYFNVGLLFKAYNEKNGTDKRFADFARFNHNLMMEIIKDETISGDFTTNTTTVEPSEKQAYRYCVKAVRGRGSDGIWCHPILFIKAAMYLDPKFEYEVLKMVKDGLIGVRSVNAEERKALNDALQANFPDDQHGFLYSNVARLIAKHIGDANDAKAQRKEQKALNQLTALIECGVIDNYDKLKEFVNKIAS